MSRRVDVNDALPPAELPRRVLNELYAHARETLPEECCGLIVGDAQERFRLDAGVDVGVVNLVVLHASSMRSPWGNVAFCVHKATRKPLARRALADGSA